MGKGACSGKCVHYKDTEKHLKVDLVIQGWKKCTECEYAIKIKRRHCPCCGGRYSANVSGARSRRILVEQREKLKKRMIKMTNTGHVGVGVGVGLHRMVAK